MFVAKIHYLAIWSAMHIVKYLIHLREKIRGLFRQYQTVGEFFSVAA